MSDNKIRRLYYSVSDVAELTGVKPHVLRFWEKEFPMLRPKRGSSGNRSYRDREIRIIEAIKHLLYDEKYTIPGAVERLRQDRSLGESVEAAPEGSLSSPDEVLAEVRELLLELKELIDTEG